MAGKGDKGKETIRGEKVPCWDAERRIYQAIDLLLKPKIRENQQSLSENKKRSRDPELRRQTPERHNQQ